MDDNAVDWTREARSPPRGQEEAEAVTQKQIERIVGVWQNRLGLDAWELTVNFKESASEDSQAEVFRSNVYDWAEMKLKPDWPKWSRKSANQTIVHELLHLHTRDMEESLKSAGPSDDVSRQQTREVEKLVDRLACRIVDIGGVV